MIKYFFIISIFMVAACSSRDSTVDKRIYVGFIDSNYNGDKKIIELTNIHYFSKDFWNYFMRKFPLTTVSIFYRHITVPPQTFIELKDTSLIVEIGGFDTFSMLYRILPDDPNAEENKSSMWPTQGFFIIGGDSSNSNVLATDIPVLNNRISADYNRFRNLLSDENNKPIIVFEKDVLVQIEQIFKQD